MSDIEISEGPKCENVEILTLEDCSVNVAGIFPNLKKVSAYGKVYYVGFVKRLKKLEELNVSSRSFEKFKPPTSLKVLKINSKLRNSSKPFKIEGNQIKELILVNLKKTFWIVDFLRNLQGRKVKLTFEYFKLNLRVQKALKVFEDKIGKLKILNCEIEENTEKLEIDLDDGEELEEEDESESESESDEESSDELSFDEDF